MKYKSTLKRLKIQKKTATFKTFRVGYTLHSYVDMIAKDEEEAKDLVGQLDTEKLTQDADFKFDYCDEIGEE